LSFDVLIVGAGPAGAATALFLLHACPELASRVALVDKARFPRDKFCAGAVAQRADDALASIGLRIDVPSVKVDGMSIAFKGGTVHRRVGAVGRVVRRLELDHALVEAVRARGARVLEGVKVHALDVRDDGVRVRTDAGELRAKVVVGADGVGSVVRRHLGLPFGALRAQVVEVDTEVLPGDAPPDLLHFDATDASYDGYAWDFPTVIGGEAKVCRGVFVLGRSDARGVRANEPPDPEPLLAARLAARGLDPRRYRVKRYAERGFEVHRPYASRRVILVGEAAGIDPLLGEGIAQGIEYGALAGKYVARKVARGSFAFRDWPWRVRASHLGVDLTVRTSLVPFAYGPVRPHFEEWLLGVPDAVDFFSMVFAGRTPPFRTFVRAGIGGGLQALRRVTRAASVKGAPAIDMHESAR
jgi:flavin-dependent dehydrogenase